MKKKKAFTLIELLVVIAIIALFDLHPAAEPPAGSGAEQAAGVRANTNANR